MRINSVVISALTVWIASAAACSGSDRTDGKTSDNVVSSECRDGTGLLVFCQDNDQTQCTESCVPYGTECTQECGTPDFNGMYLFCPGNEGECHAFPDSGETGCSSYVYAQNDPANCGMCNTNCASCHDMICSCTDDGTPVNLFVDPNNCGACGNVCASGVCAEAKCQ